MSGEVGFRNGDLIAKNITFDYKSVTDAAQPGVITADGQILIGSVITTPDIAMKPGFLHPASGNVTVNYNPVTGNLDIDTTVGGGTLSTLTPDVGGVVNPVGNNINVKGLPILAGQTRRLQTETTNIGGPNLQVKAPNCALFIVDKNPLYGTHITIQSAVNDAATQQLLSGKNQTVFLRPDIYTENVTMAPGVNLASFASEGRSSTVKIKGQLLINAAGPNAFTGIRFETNGNYAIAVTTTGASPQITFINCSLIAADFNALLTSVNCTITFAYCEGDILDGASAYCTLNAGTVFFNTCRMFNISASAGITVVSNANLNMAYTGWNNRVQTLPGSSFGVGNCTFRTGGLPGPILQFNATSVSQIAISYSYIDSQNQVAIDVAATVGILLQCVTINCFGAAAITGAGSMTYTPIFFSSATSTCTIAGQNPTGIGPRIAVSGQSQLISGAGNPNGVVTAGVGSIWMRSDGGAAVNNRAYVNTNGATGWTAFLTVS